MRSTSSHELKSTKAKQTGRHRAPYRVHRTIKIIGVVAPAAVLVGVFVAKFPTGVRVAVTGAAPAVFRVPAFEAALSRRFEPDAVNGHGIDPAGLNSDIHAEAAFRAHLAFVMARRAVAQAAA